MTKYQLIQLLTTGALKDAPGNMDIFIRKTNNNFELSLLESGEVEESGFSEPGNADCYAVERVIVLSDEI